MIKIGLKANAAFLFPEMKGNTLGGTEGNPFWRSILHVTEQQFEQFKRLITTFGGNLAESLTESHADGIDYECYFVRA